jgi:hypothetical protein
LTKLELVDLMPASASLACLAGLPHLRHLIVEYKDGSAMPNLSSIGQLQGLTQLELSLHRFELLHVGGRVVWKGVVLGLGPSTSFDF